MQAPLAQLVGPEYPLPPHCPYRLCPAAELVTEVIVLGADVVVVEPVVVLFTVLEVLTEVVLVAMVVLELAAPGTMAELVTEAIVLVWATELGKPLYRVGPGIV